MILMDARCVMFFFKQKTAYEMRISDWSSDVCSSDLIFTGNSISLSMYWRQWGSRYAIRAGRNLPDKEFRYLRTVIVTAAVYRGFNSELAPLLLTFRHRAGVRPYTSS